MRVRVGDGRTDLVALWEGRGVRLEVPLGATVPLELGVGATELDTLVRAVPVWEAEMDEVSLAVADTLPVALCVAAGVLERVMLGVLVLVAVSDAVAPMVPLGVLERLQTRGSQTDRRAGQQDASMVEWQRSGCS